MSRNISYRSLFLVIIVSFLMVGCACDPVMVYHTEVVSPPAYLTEKIEPEAPPVISGYVGLRYYQKEEILIDKFREQTLNVEKLNAQMDSIRKWIDDQTKLYQKKE